MKKPIKKKNIFILFTLGIFLLLGTSLFLLKNYSDYQKSLRTPFDIVVANTTIDSTEIYWKIKEEDFQILSYKEESFTGPYTQAFSDVLLYKDNISNANLYITRIENLEPNTKYIFRIDSARGIERKEFYFKTKQVKEEVSVPNIMTGDTHIDKLVLISLDSGDNIILDTAKHGTWAFDNQGKGYEKREYAQISTEEELKASLRNFLTPKVFAREERGANCMTGIDVKDYSLTKIDKSRFVNKAETAIYSSCQKGNYANECFDDVYCTSLEKGVNPAFTLTIWFQETDASNYARAYRDGVDDLQDFGIRDSSVFFDFTGQLNWLIDNIAVDTYINNCNTIKQLSIQRSNLALADPKWDNIVLDKLVGTGDQVNLSLSGNRELFRNILWAARYWKGDDGCNSIDGLTKGLIYYTKTLRNYRHILTLQGNYNDIQFPFRISPNSSVCDRTKQVQNTVFKKCDGTTVGTNPNPENPTDCSSNPPGKKDIKIGEMCTDGGGCECFDGEFVTENYLKDVPCGEICTEDDPDEGKVILEVTDEDQYCRSTKGCICYWNNKEVREEVEKGYTCTVDGEVIETVNICCLEDDKLSVKMPYNCNGVFREDIPIQNCKNTNVKYELKKGVNFINPVEALDTEETLYPKTAHDLINMSDKRVIAVGEYKSGEWVQVVKYEEGKIYGDDFLLDSNKSYMVISLQEAEFKVNGYRLPAPDVLKLSGWNLVPSYIFKNKGATSYDILQNLEFNKVKQIGQWQNHKGLFDYTIKDKKNNIFGEKLQINNQEGIFVKVLQ